MLATSTSQNMRYYYYLNPFALNLLQRDILLNKLEFNISFFCLQRLWIILFFKTIQSIRTI